LGEVLVLSPIEKKSKNPGVTDVLTPYTFLTGLADPEYDFRVKRGALRIPVYRRFTNTRRPDRLTAGLCCEPEWIGFLSYGQDPPR
jgi:hypothetical protein